MVIEEGKTVRLSSALLLCCSQRPSAICPSGYAFRYNALTQSGSGRSLSLTLSKPPFDRGKLLSQPTFLHWALHLPHIRAISLRPSHPEERPQNSLSVFSRLSLPLSCWSYLSVLNSDLYNRAESKLPPTSSNSFLVPFPLFVVTAVLVYRRDSTTKSWRLCSFRSRAVHCGKACRIMSPFAEKLTRLPPLKEWASAELQSVCRRKRQTRSKPARHKAFFSIVCGYVLF